MKTSVHVLLISLCLLVFNPTLKAQKPIDFQYSESLIFLNLKINGNKANFLFILNTSANTSVIDKRTANILKLPVIRAVDSIEGTAGKEPATVREIKSLQAGNAMIKNMEVGCRDLSGFITLRGKPIDGVLGTDFLKYFSISIDFKKHTLLFVKNKTLIDRQKFIPFEMDDGIPRIEAKLNDTLLTCLHYNSGLGTSESRNVFVNVSYPQWQEINATSPRLMHEGYVTGQGVGGMVYMQVVRLKGLQLNNMDIMSAYAVIQPKEGYFKRENAIGFFSNNLLEKYNNVTIDFPGNKIVIGQPAKRKPVPMGVKRILVFK